MTEEGTVIARNGHLPILVLGKGELSEGITIPIKPLKVLSTLGAGDSFDGAFLHEIAQGEGAADAARKASDYAGLFISGKL
jgi:sugar/nucleoside kinase (ribokinase family)